MKTDVENKLLAVVRVRGSVKVRQEIKETLSRLNLDRVNNLSLVFGTKSNIGMIRKCNDFITYGEIDEEKLSLLLSRKKVELSKEDLKEISTGRLKPREKINMPIKMSPPKGGYKGTKRSFSQGGALGYRGDAISALLDKMN
ncbi:uL30 family ribosomal protein [Candidatus Marsarchaeota archaeon]|nr:uL30 family ribosomal protein [Candidatus Marsarchaeota archaeon]